MNAITSPSHAAFRAGYEAGRGTLVWTTGVADLETPVAAYMKLASPSYSEGSHTPGRNSS